MSETTREWREAGECSNCATPVTIVHNSDHPTCMADGRRYVDARFVDQGWCLFRCKACHAVISDTWKPTATQATPTTTQEQQHGE